MGARGAAAALAWAGGAAMGAGGQVFLPPCETIDMRTTSSFKSSTSLVQREETENNSWGEGGVEEKTTRGDSEKETRRRNACFIYEEEGGKICAD